MDDTINDTKSTQWRDICTFLQWDKVYKKGVRILSNRPNKAQKNQMYVMWRCDHIVNHTYSSLKTAQISRGSVLWAPWRRLTPHRLVHNNHTQTEIVSMSLFCWFLPAYSAACFHTAPTSSDCCDWGTRNTFSMSSSASFVDRLRVNGEDMLVSLSNRSSLPWTKRFQRISCMYEIRHLLHLKKTKKNSNLLFHVGERSHFSFHPSLVSVWYFVHIMTLLHHANLTVK